MSIYEYDQEKHMRQEREDVYKRQVLVLSAYDNFEYVRTALRNGAENYLLKPLNPEELLESIQSVAKHLKERNTLSNTYGSSMLTFRSLFTENLSLIHI